MRFWTIWTLPACTIREKLRRTRDWAAQRVGSFLPQRVRYFVTLREIARATRESKNIPATPLEDVLRNLVAPRNHI